MSARQQREPSRKRPQQETRRPRRGARHGHRRRPRQSPRAHACPHRPRPRRHAARGRCSTPIRTESTPSSIPFLNAPGAAPFQDATPGPPTAPCKHTDAPSSGTDRVQRLQRLPVRAECNGSERLRTERSSHRAQTHRRNAPSPPRTASGTPPGIPPRRPSPDRRRVWRAREPASTRRVQRPREPTRHAPSEAAPKTRRHVASDGRPTTGRRHAT